MSKYDLLSVDGDAKTKKGKAFRIWAMPATKPWDGTLPPSAIQRYQEAAVKLPDRCLAFGMQQAFRKGETRIKVSVARVEPNGTRSSSVQVQVAPHRGQPRDGHLDGRR